MNLWTTLVDVAPKNGCLRMVPGSHLLSTQIRGTIGTFRWPELIPLIERLAEAFAYGTGERDDAVMTAR